MPDPVSRPVSGPATPVTPEVPFASVAILGLGVMGGSLARAASMLDPLPRIVGWSPSAGERTAALQAGAVAAAPEDWADAVSEADLVVLAAPLGASCELVASVLEAMSAEATLSDVASLKMPLANAVEEAGGADRWVGSHPMAGSEASGFAAATTDLYVGARVWLVAHDGAAHRVPLVSSFWKALGARPEPIDAEDHDRLMALASHLPQLTSNALARVLSDGGVTPDRLGPGGADMTRLAGSSPALWRDILRHASPELVSGLRSLAETATGLANDVERGDLDLLEKLMDETSEWRRGE